ncbi:MAG: tRNA (N6-threonylcarbamoyladenosine(37)-N6)-methyltransferase TrmO [Polyangiaceae bacterium]|nr:tRNA (N6-threonylcarbamoyladenosine(37)-N6)-methyltransferase TrmO [Polyangiaceae bacterium]
MRERVVLPPLSLVPIGVIRTPFLDKASAPRQPAAAIDVAGTIELTNTAEMRDAASDLASWSRIWVVFWFHEAHHFSPKVTPPRGDGKKVGVLATRSPHRPNPIGLSALRLARVDGCILHVCDVDILDGTPVLDVKPYVPYTDAFPDEKSGWLSDPKESYRVVFSVLAEEQLVDIMAGALPDLRVRIETLLATGPEPHAYRRIRKSREGSVLAVKEWRALFVDRGDHVLEVLRIDSGYSPRERAKIPFHNAYAEKYAGRLA